MSFTKTRAIAYFVFAALCTFWAAYSAETNENLDFLEKVAADVQKSFSSDWKMYSVDDMGLTWHGVRYRPADYPSDISSPNQILRIRFAAANSVENARRLMMHALGQVEVVHSIKNPFKAGDESFQNGNIFVTRVGTTVVEIDPEESCPKEQLEKVTQMVLDLLQKDDSH